MQDRRGHLSFGTYDGGVSWYDGQTWGTFTTLRWAGERFCVVDAPGLGLSRSGDGEGHFWFSTNGGISRYDRQVFTVFTRTDGLGHDRVYSIQQDRRGHLWFGTSEGVSRYNGQSFTTADGLAGNAVWSIFHVSDSRGSGDREGEASPAPTLWFGTLEHRGGNKQPVRRSRDHLCRSTSRA